MFSCKESVQARLDDGTCILLEKPSSSRSSSGWDNFKVVVEKVSNTSVGYVQCQKEDCKTLLTYKGSTTGMIRHKCKERRQSSRTAVSVNDKTTIRDTTVSVNDKTTIRDTTVSVNDKTIRDKCVLMCATDLRPFNIVSGEGFINLCQELISIGAKRGQINAQDVLPSPKTVSRHIQEMADEVRRDFIPKIKEAIDKNQCAMTCDLWADNYRKIHYLTVTSTYIEDSEERWEARNNVLLTTKFPEDAKTGDNILTEIYDQMAELEITASELKKVTFVTEQRPNIKKALENHNRLPCVMHCINTALRHTLNETFLSNEIPEVFHSIQSARKIVGFMKRSGLVTRLQKTLLQDIETRWNSIYLMLDSFHSQRIEVEAILNEKNKQEMITLYREDIMERVINFLHYFKEATDALEGVKEPTLPFVIPWLFNLLDSCQTVDDDEQLCKLKERAEKFLREKVLNEMSDIHYVATLLHPSFKELLVLNEEKRKTIHQIVKQMINNVSLTLAAEVEEDSESPPGKKFRKWCPCPSNRRDELEKYIKMDCPNKDCWDLLSWWKTNAGAFPKLAKLAKEVFCIPASSASSERNFSRAGLIVSEKRNHIDPDRVNDILTIHNNKKSK